MDKLLERYSKVPPRQRYALIGLGLALLVAGYYYLFYGDITMRLAEADRRYRELEAQRVEKQAYIEHLAKYEARLNELQQDLNQARAQLPDEADVPQLLAQLGNKARQSGLEIERFEPKPEVPKDVVAEVAFAVKVRGSYHEIATFIDSVGKLDRITNVTEIAMINPKTVSQKIVVDGEFMVKTYRFLGGQPAGK